MNDEKDPDTIHVESTVSATNIDPNVLIQWGDSTGILSATNTRKRAVALISAIAMAQTEGGIFKTLAPNMKPQGFGKAQPPLASWRQPPARLAVRLNKQEDMAVNVLCLIRKVRAPLPPDIEPIFGYNTQKPLIKYRWGSIESMLELNTAKHHAQALLEAAESAETDSFFYKFCERQNLDKQIAEDILLELHLFRQQNQLENLFGETLDD